MTENNEALLRIPHSVREDTFNFRDKLNDFLSGHTSDAAFRAVRVLMGIYEQRETGKYMIRIRIGAGLVLPLQLRQISELSKQYGDGILHITTRQDIQIHKVNIEDTYTVVERLLDVGLSVRGGGGNAVRNITACDRSGVCPDEHFSVAPHAVAAAEYLLQHESSYTLPRKYKIVFSGCSKDCALASTADLGFFAHIKDGQQGFSVYAGGGLGTSPQTGVQIEAFITPDNVPYVAEAAKQLFDAHGDRANRRRARLRYVLVRLGEQEFVRLYKQYKDNLIAQGLTGEVPEPREIGCVPSRPAHDGAKKTPHEGIAAQECILREKMEGYLTLKVRLPLGDVAAADLVRVGDIAERFGCGLVRVSQLQNLLIPSVSEENLPNAVEALKKTGIDMTTQQANLINCTGATTCKLGICLSRGLSKAIADTVRDIDVDGLEMPSIRISGCPNSCANHHVATLGFEGRVKRVQGRLMPCYQVLAGAEIREGQTRLAQKIGILPAKRVPAFVKDCLLQKNANDTDALKALVSRHAQLPEDIPEAYYDDFGAGEHRIDLRGVACPLNFAKAKLRLEGLEKGQVLEVLLDEGQPAQNVPASFARQGQEVLDVQLTGDYYCLRVRRIK